MALDSAHELGVSLRAAALLVPLTAARLLHMGAWRLSRMALGAADAQIALRLTDWAYRRDRDHGTPAHLQRGLFAFESEAIQAHFPPPPARLFVPGCGAGRELLALVAQGYTVTGSEPSPKLLAEARRQLPDIALFAGGLADVPAGLAPPYDAVLVGWGAWGHLPTATERIAALQLVRPLCPQGPVLVSWRLEAAPPLRKTAEVPGLQGTFSHRGLFQARIGRADIVREAKAADYKLVFYGPTGLHGYAHAVLRPRGTSEKASS